MMNRKLDVKEVIALRRQKYSMREIADIYGVSRQAVFDCLRRNRKKKIKQQGNQW